MKQQLVFIHGGEAYSDPRDYEMVLADMAIDIDPVSKQRWHYTEALSRELGDQWQVIRPDMPCPEHAQYEHWKLYFEKYIPYLQDGVVLVGHSLGAMFLARYLSEHRLPVSVSKLFLLAGMFCRPSPRRGVEDGEYFFTQQDNYIQLGQSAEHIYIVHSRDDPVVPFDDIDLWQAQLPDAQAVVFDNKNHFLDEQFPELIDLITS